MNPQTIINIAFAITGFLGGWILKIIWDEIKLLQKNQKGIEHDISSNYVRKDDYRVDIAEVKGMLVRIFDKLDGKADK